MKIKVLGTRHCFNTIADSTDNLLSTKEMNKVVSPDANARTVTIEGGNELWPAMSNLKRQDLHCITWLRFHIFLWSACTTATHGSGVKMATLPPRRNWFADRNRQRRYCKPVQKEDAEQFNAAVISLGALGVIAKITLALQPAFKMKQYVFERLPLQELSKNLIRLSPPDIV